MSSSSKLLVVGGILVVLVGGRLLMGDGHDSEPVRRAPRRVVVAPAATEQPAPPPAPAPAPAPPKKEDVVTPRGMAMTDSQRLREAALEDIDRFEKAGRYQEALDAIDEAQQNGADKSKLEPTRVRLRALAAEGRKLDDAFAAADLALSNGEHDQGLRALASVVDVATKLDRKGDLDERVARINAARDRAVRLQKGMAAVTHARELLDASDIVGARAEVEKARGLVPGSPELATVETRLHDQEKLPKGFVYVLVTSERGLYVRKAPVSNADFKKWIDETGRTGAAPWSAYPEAQADLPVRGVFVDAAKNFAASRSERLPSDEEWTAIKKALHLVEDGKPHAGVFATGFYTVKTP